MLFHYLYSEIILYIKDQSKGITEIEKKLSMMGNDIGRRLCELYHMKMKVTHLEGDMLSMLNFISNDLWRKLFDKAADGLEKSTNEDVVEYMIIDNDPFTNQFISMPKGLEKMSCASLIGGIIESFVNGNGFKVSVTSFNVPADGWSNRTVFLLKPFQ